MSYKFNFADLWTYWPDFLAGALVTLELTVIATIVGLVLGILGAAARGSRFRLLRSATAVYVEIVRNTPFLIQIFFFYFGLASAGLRLPVFAASVLAMVINVGAYSTEIIRAGIDSVHPSQIEAAEALGLSMTSPIVFWDIVLRPAVERVYPALTSQFVLMMLSSSVASQISAEELTATANRIQSINFRSLESYVVVAAIYLALTVLLNVSFWAFGQALFPRRRKLGTPL